MYILGLNLSHDSSACLIKDGKPKVALALERLVRVKRGLVPATQFTAAIAELIDYCLESEGIRLDDIDYFVGSTTETSDQEGEQHILRDVGILPRLKILALPHPSHHLTHASASFFASGFSEAAALVVDAYGSRVDNGRESESGYFFGPAGTATLTFRTTHSSARIAGILHTGRLTIPSELSGICEIYRVVTLALGFRQPGTYYDDAGKTMGLAPYGSRLAAEPQMIRLGPNGLDFSQAYAFLRDNNVISEGDGHSYLNCRDNRSPLSKFHKDLAAQVQWEFEEGCLYLVRRLLAKTGADKLVLGGGGFLNSVVNHRILRETAARDLFIFPAATDDGNAFGAAMYAYHILLGNSRKAQCNGTRNFYLGRAYDSQRVESCLKSSGVKYEHKRDMNEMACYAADRLASGAIIGWYQGGAEFGPRALGNRSILASPMIEGAKSHLNGKVKFRESFRPYGASVPVDQAERFFDIVCVNSPYMLLVCSVRESARSKIGETVHVDGSCRIQTVHPSDNLAFYQLLRSFGSITSVPVLINTSFNTRGMPIVETPEDALDCLFSTQLDALVIGSYWIEAPTFESFVPNCHELRISAIGPWQGGPASIRMDDFNVSVWRANLENAQEYRLSRFQWAMLQAITGRLDLAGVANSLNISTDIAVFRALELYRMGLIYWGHLGPVVERRASRANFNLSG